MKRVIVISMVVLGANTAKSQDIDFGINTATNLFYRANVDNPYFFPANSYHSYYSGSPNKDVINKNGFLNSISLGSTISASYNRWAFTIEPQYFYQRLILRFDYPIQVNRILGRRAFRMPLFFKFNLQKKAHGPFAMFGLIAHKENNFDFQSPGKEVYLDAQPLSNVAVDFGDNHFYDIMYNEKLYFSYLLGLGVKTRRGIDYSIRYHKRLNTANRGIQANITNIEFTINFPVVSVSDFTKKHFIYAD
jgi:hypothetical protein